jgi:hypothetical protein
MYEKYKNIMRDKQRVVKFCSYEKKLSEMFTFSHNDGTHFTCVQIRVHGM